jgi:uncharacterized membrane protein YeaQ/YmgE (transglycosylase-associated protein family)
MLETLNLKSAPLAISAHWRKYNGLTVTRFIVRVLCESTLVRAAVSILMALFVQDQGGGRAVGFDFNSVLWITLLAPAVETALLQTIPIYVVGRFTDKFWVKVTVSTLCFAVFHLSLGWKATIMAGVIGGFYLGFTYAHWSTISHRSAFWITYIIHALLNSALMLLIAGLSAPL